MDSITHSTYHTSKQQPDRGMLPLYCFFPISQFTRRGFLHPKGPRPQIICIDSACPDLTGFRD